MIFLVIGGASSGKSGFAEALACERARQEQRPLVYLATMQPYGDAGRLRVDRHRAMRAGKGFETVECYGSLDQARVDPSAVVLLECLGNLVANLQFGPDWEPYPAPQVLERAFAGFSDLAGRCAHLVVVSNEVASDGVDYGAPTCDYVEVLGALNRFVTSCCDEAYEVVAGIPLLVKEPNGEFDR